MAADLSPNLRLAAFWNCLDERQKLDLQQIKSPVLLRKHCCEFCQELLRASMTVLEKEVTARWQGSKDGIKIYVTPKGDFLPETSLGPFVRASECAHVFTIDVAQGPTYTIELGYGDSIVEAMSRRMDPPETQKKKGGGKKKGKKGGKKGGGGKKPSVSSLVPKEGGVDDHIGKKMDTVLVDGGWGVEHRKCWYCRDKLYIRFTDLLTYPRPIREFRMLLDKETTLAELEALITDDVNRGNAAEMKTLDSAGKRAAKFKTDEPVLLMRKGKVLVGKSMTMQDLGLRTNNRLVISRPIGKKVEVDSSMQERNRQFVGDLLFGQDPSEESGCNSIIESYRLNYGHQILGMLVCKSMGERVQVAWEAEISARVHQQDLLDLLGEEETQASKKAEKSKKKKELARKKKEEQQRLKEEEERKIRRVEEANARAKRKAEEDKRAAERHQREQAERAKREEAERLWRLEKAKQDAEEREQARLKAIEDKKRREAQRREEKERRAREARAAGAAARQKAELAQAAKKKALAEQQKLDQEALAIRKQVESRKEKDKLVALQQAQLEAVQRQTEQLRLQVQQQAMEMARLQQRQQTFVGAATPLAPSADFQPTGRDSRFSFDLKPPPPGVSPHPSGESGFDFHPKSPPPGITQQWPPAPSVPLGQSPPRSTADWNTANIGSNSTFAHGTPNGQGLAPGLGSGLGTGFGVGGSFFGPSASGVGEFSTTWEPSSAGPSSSFSGADTGGDTWGMNTATTQQSNNHNGGLWGGVSTFNASAREDTELGNAGILPDDMMTSILGSIDSFLPKDE